MSIFLKNAAPTLALAASASALCSDAGAQTSSPLLPPGQKIARGQGLRADYFAGHDFGRLIGSRRDASLNFDWGTGAPVPGAGEEFSVRWTGTLRAPKSGIYTLEVQGAQVWRLAVNQVPLLDTLSAKDYEDDWKKNRRFDRHHQTTIALRAGVRYPFQFEYAKKNQGQITPSKVKLLWQAPGVPLQIVPTSALEVASGKPQPEVARSAREFYQSVGVGFNGSRLSPQEYERQKARLRELGIYTVRMGLHPWAGELGTLPRFLDLYQTLGIKSCGLVRERFETDDPAIIMARLREETKAVLPSLLMVEGPNEVNVGPERFSYRGHGYARGGEEEKLIGEGWPLGVSLFMRDLHAALKSDPATARVPIANATISGGAWVNPTGAQEWQSVAQRHGLDLSRYVDYGNYHKYHMTHPDSVRHQDMISGFVHSLTPSKPHVTTETGFNTGTESHDQVSESVQAKYLLRNHLVTFNAGTRHAYTFTLVDFENSPILFGLLRTDLTPKPSFVALRNLLALVKEPQATPRAKPFAPGALDYRLSGDESGIERTLLQREDGRFLLVLWQEINSTQTMATPRTLRLQVNGQFASARVHTPLTGAVQTDATPRDVSVAVGDHPTVVEFIPARSGEKRQRINSPQDYETCLRRLMH